MKKITLISGLFIGTALNIPAQTMIQNWLTKSNNASITNSDDKPYYTHVDANGMIGIVGVSNNKVILATYDANGNDLWTNKLESFSSDSPLGLEKGPNGNYYVGYYWGGTIRKVGLSGGNAWTTASSSYHGADFVVDANGDVYSIGTDYARSIIYIDKILANGSLIWTKTYTGFYGLGGQPKHVKMDNNGNLLIAMDAISSSGDRFLSVVKFDTIGSNTTQLWHNVYSTTKGEVVDFRVDNVTNASYVTGAVDVGGFNQRDMIVYKSGPSGAINWSDVYNEANSDDKGYSLEQDAAGNVYVLFDSHTPMTKYSIRKYTTGGALLASNGVTYVGNISYGMAPKIKIHPGNNQIYFSATKWSTGNNNMMVIYKTDPSLSSINQIYSYDYDNTDYDYSTSMDIDPVSQNLILTGNIYGYTVGNNYFYAKTDTLGSFLYSGEYNGIINGSDYATSMITDASNMPLVAGGTKTTSNGLDGFMVKYDAVGNEQWQAIISGQSSYDDYLNAVDINTSGHYYAGGFSKNGSNEKSMWMVKVDGNGTKLWDLFLNGSDLSGNNEARDVYTDNFNNGYAAGYQANMGTGEDATIVKFNSSGNVLWTKKYTSSGNQKDGYMDIGSKNGTALYAVGYTTKSNGESDMLITKYDGSGNLQWSRTLNSPNNGNDTAIAVNVDANQNIAIAGRGDSTKAVVVKYDASGTLLWSAIPSNVTEIGPDVLTQQGGRTYITCFFDSSSVYSNRIFCYDNTGSELWHKDYVYGCCEHPMKLYKTTRGTIIMANDYNGQIGAIELDSMGNELNNILTNLNIQYGDGAYGGTRDVKIDGNGDVYVTGYFSADGNTGSDLVMQKICYTPAPVAISGALSICEFSVGNVYSVTSNTTVTGYNWGATGGLTIAGSSLNGASVNAGSSSGYVYVQQTNYCGTSQPDTLYVNVTPLPAVNAGADMLICPNTAVTLSGSGAQTYAWSGGVVDGVSFTPTMTQGYQLTGTDSNGCSNKDTVIIMLKTPPVVSLCQVTVDTFSTHNILTWEKTGLTNEIDYFNIYREDITNNYTLIGAVDYDSLSQYHDYDTLMADPNVTTKRYKIAAVDSCGNEGPKSGFHNTIFISNNNGTFTWNTYTIQNQSNPVNNYNLLRDDFANGNWQVIGTTAGTQNVLNDPNYSTFATTADWRVETVWNISCTPTVRLSNGVMGAIVKSKSNITNNRVVGIKNNTLSGLSAYPNPANNGLTVNLGSVLEGKTILKLYSVLGQEVYSASVEGTSIHQIDLTNLENGSYLLKVTGNNKTGTMRVVKQ